MKHSLNLLCMVALAAFLLLPQTAFANAFLIMEMSGEGTGQGGAMGAAGGSPSNQFYNPANLSWSKGLQLEAGFTGYIPGGGYESPTGETNDALTDFIPAGSVSLAYKPLDWLSIGVMGFPEFGLAVRWPKEFEGSYLARESELLSFTVNPNISFGPFKGFAIAAGFDAKWGQVHIIRDFTLGQIPATSTADNSAEFIGSTWGFGGNVGMLYQPAWWTRFGMSYRSSIYMDMSEGKANFNVAEPWQQAFQDQDFKTSITLPHLLNWAGRFWIPNTGLSLELDIWLTMWSTYDKLTFEFSEPLNGTVSEKTEQKQWEDSVQVRLGGEWWFHDNWAWRFGFIFDQNPVPDEYLDPMLPDSNRVDVSTGFGCYYNGFRADLAYMLVYFLGADTTGQDDVLFPGKFDVITHVLSASVGYDFDLGDGRYDPRKPTNPDGSTYTGEDPLAAPAEEEEAALVEEAAPVEEVAPVEEPAPAQADEAAPMPAEETTVEDGAEAAPVE